jgi:Rrf2 family nitric oxide-sensitive transcriptional repressor
MRLTKTTGHAIRILIDCAESDGERVKVASIAGRLGISQLNAFKIVHILSKAGFIEAMRGRNGGVKLALDPASIRIGTVVREIEATEVGVAGTDGTIKRRVKSPINAIFDSALEAFIGVLDRHTVADLAVPRKRRPAPRLAVRPVAKAPAAAKKSKAKVLAPPKRAANARSARGR